MTRQARSGRFGRDAQVFPNLCAPFYLAPCKTLLRTRDVFLIITDVEIDPHHFFPIGGIAVQELQEFLDVTAYRTVGVRYGRAADREPLQSIEFLSAAGALRSNVIYLLTEAELPELARRNPLPAAVFFILCDGETPPALPPDFPDDAAAVFVHGELLPLYTLLNDTLSRIRDRRRIDDILRMGENMQYTPEQMVHALSEMLNVGLYILNGAYQLICGNVTGVPDDSFPKEINRLGGLSPESVRRIRAGGLPAMLYEDSNNGWSAFAVLLLWDETQHQESRYLCEHLADFILHSRSRSALSDIPPFLIDQRLNRVLLGRTTDEAEIKAVLGIGPDPAWFSVLVLRAEPDVRWSPDAYQMHVHLLRAALRDAQVSVVRGLICAVVRIPLQSPEDAVYSRSFFSSRAYADGWDAERLEQTLVRYGAYLCRSSLFRSLSWYNFSTYFELVADALEVAIRLDGCRGRRIVDYWDYSSYIAVKYSVDRFLESHKPRNIKALLYPELVTLLHHDARHHGDLATVLYTYYTLGDVQRTAQALFVHRNTIYNKLKSIAGLLDADLDDRATRSSYLTSLRIYYYCQKCLGLDMPKIMALE